MRLLKPTSPEPLGELPNISSALAHDLQIAGVECAEELETIGAEAAWELLQAANLHPNVETLLALEGAIERATWSSVPANRRFELMAFLVKHAA